VINIQFNVRARNTNIRSDLFTLQDIINLYFIIKISIGISKLRSLTISSSLYLIFNNLILNIFLARDIFIFIEENFTLLKKIMRLMGIINISSLLEIFFLSVCVELSKLFIIFQIFVNNLLNIICIIL